MTVRILTGDCRQLLETLPDQSVHCCVTSPPYYGLRDYGMDGQIGLEMTYASYVSQIVAVFEEVRRVLRDDGTLWLNLGDSYAGSWGAQVHRTNEGVSGGQIANHPKRASHTGSIRDVGLKPKDLIGIPWRVAFALQVAGWWLRQDIVWAKPNPMPESVTDRCTKSHEYLFLLAKSESYHCDMAAIREASADLEGSTARYESAFGGEKARAPIGAAGIDTRTRPSGMREFDGMRNKRSVWTVATRPFKEAHFATFPPELIVPCVLAGCPVGGVVLDPFGGAGTTGLVADSLQRDAILIELNPAYAAMASARITGDSPMFAEVAAA